MQVEGYRVTRVLKRVTDNVRFTSKSKHSGR